MVDQLGFKNPSKTRMAGFYVAIVFLCVKLLKWWMVRFAAAEERRLRLMMRAYHSVESTTTLCDHSGEV